MKKYLLKKKMLKTPSLKLRLKMILQKQDVKKAIKKVASFDRKKANFDLMKTFLKLKGMERDKATKGEGKN